MDEANTALAAAQADLTTANTSLTEAGAAIAALTASNETLEANVADLSAKLDAAAADLAEADAASAALSEANKALTEANAALTASNEALTAANAALTTEKATLEASVADLSAKLDETTATLAAMTEAKAEADASIAALTEEKSAISAELSCTSDELTATKSTLTDAQSTMVSLLSRNAIAKGYNGNITVSAIVNGQGAIAYLTVDASGETEGLGQKVMETEYLVQFLGKKLPLTLGEDVDAVAGATITSQAVVDALNLLAPDYSNNRTAPVIEQRSVTKAVAYVQNVQGHESTMKVVVYTTPEGVVTDVNVYAEGETNGQDVMSNAFTSQFVGHSSEVTLGVEVDAVAGATATSQAVVDAVNNIIK